MIIGMIKAHLTVPQLSPGFRRSGSAAEQ